MMAMPGRHMSVPLISTARVAGPMATMSAITHGIRARGTNSSASGHSKQNCASTASDHA
jgi:hypothetical protein